VAEILTAPAGDATLNAFDIGPPAVRHRPDVTPFMGPTVMAAYKHPMRRCIPLPSLLLVLLLCGTLAGCASVPRPREATLGERIAATALAQIGRPYLYGGSTPEGFDCSGLVRYAYLAAGLDVPRTTTEQFQAVRTIRLETLAPGDLLFFRIDSREVTHVGIYTGEGRFVHAPQSGKSVETRALDDDWYRQRLVSAGRFY
jgi:murein DD-endopeptidase